MFLKLLTNRIRFFVCLAQLQTYKLNGFENRNWWSVDFKHQFYNINQKYMIYMHVVNVEIKIKICWTTDQGVGGGFRKTCYLQSHSIWIVSFVNKDVYIDLKIPKSLGHFAIRILQLASSINYICLLIVSTDNQIWGSSYSTKYSKLAYEKTYLVTWWVD